MHDMKLDACPSGDGMQPEDPVGRRRVFVFVFFAIFGAAVPNRNKTASLNQ